MRLSSLPCKPARRMLSLINLQHLIGVAETRTNLVLASPIPVCLLSGLMLGPSVHITCGRTLIMVQYSNVHE